MRVQTTIHYEKGEVRRKTYTGQGVQIENGVMYYSDGQTIKSYDILTGYEESTGLPAMNDFTVVDNGRTKAVYTTIADGYKSELAVYSFDTSVGKMERTGNGYRRPEVYQKLFCSIRCTE